MTNSADKTMEKTEISRSKSPAKNWRFLWLFGNFIFLLFMGGVGGILGILMAQKFPLNSPNSPLVENLFQSGKILLNSQKNPTILPSPFPSPSPILLPKISLNVKEREELKTELTELQTDLNRFIGKTANLEKKMGISRPTDPLENRINFLSQQLGNLEGNPLPNDSVNSEKMGDIKAQMGTDYSLSVTFPSDSLFIENSATFTPGASIILDNLIVDLKRYSSGTIRVGVHTDNQGDSQQNQVLSLGRAQAVSLYLSKHLLNQYRWILIGYGNTRPFVENSSENNRQRNRRVEVSLSP